jgi:hypothetical protein
MMVQGSGNRSSTLRVLRGTGGWNRNVFASAARPRGHPRTCGWSRRWTMIPRRRPRIWSRSCEPSSPAKRDTLD